MLSVSILQLPLFLATHEFMQSSVPEFRAMQGDTSDISRALTCGLLAGKRLEDDIKK